MTQADWNFYSNAEFCNVCYGNLYRDNERDETPLFDEGTGLCLRQAQRECAQKLPMQNQSWPFEESDYSPTPPHTPKIPKESDFSLT